ncbi:hypothetical protein HW555_011735, partial [Spodoptera exigua]
MECDWNHYLRWTALEENKRFKNRTRSFKRKLNSLFRRKITMVDVEFISKVTLPMYETYF